MLIPKAWCNRCALYDAGSEGANRGHVHVGGQAWWLPHAVSSYVRLRYLRIACLLGECPTWFRLRLRAAYYAGLIRRQGTTAY